jgi:ferrous iron transport protein B
MSIAQHCDTSGPGISASYGTLKTVVLVGPPNSGKTTLFNQLTGLHQKVANFPGVTVDHHTGLAELADGRAVRIIDIPGIYSMAARSEDERVAFEVLTGARADTPKPDAILLVLDSTNLTRHLMLAAPILSLGVPTLVILNMADDLHTRSGKLDLDALSRELGTQVVLVAARSGEGMDQVREFLASAMPTPTPVFLPVLKDVPKCREWAGSIGLSAAYRPPLPPVWTRRLDNVFLHPVAGPAVFGLVVVAVFQTIFTAATPLMDGVGWLFDRSGDWISATVTIPWLRSLLVEGIWSGVGSVVKFLPQILLLFLFIGILEDSGYLARAALIADRSMARFGLQGKSFIPLLSAYACAVPAVMATRTIENKRDRIATILIAPFMTCSARLPVYTLIVAAFIPKRPVFHWLPFLSSQTAAILGLYLLGFAAAVLTARALKSSVLKTERTSFLMEMPSYRWPTLRSLGLRLLDRGQVFLIRAGTVILAVTIVLWIMAKLPLHDGKPPAIEKSLAGMVGRTIEPVIKPLGFNWKIGIGLITSLAAREVIVGTLGTIYGMEKGADEHSKDLQSALHHDLSLGGAIALLVFFAFAMQCTSTIAVVRRETGGWKWPAIQFTYMTVLAYVGALAAYHIWS